MQSVTISQITDSLRKLPSDRLSEVYDFVVFLAQRESPHTTLSEGAETYVLDTMLTSEDVLSRDWDSAEEDTAWANL